MTSMLLRLSKSATFRIRGFVEQIRIGEPQVFLAVTIGIGLLAGLSAVLFTISIDAAGKLFFGAAPGSVRLLLVPPLVSLVAGVLLARFFPDARGSGVPQTKAAYHLTEGVIPARVPLGKFLTGVLCVGAGHSLGREGPSVQIGAGIASVIGRRLRLSPARVKSLVPVASAAAVAAAFNTPIAAVLFALEELVGDMSAPVLGSTVLAAVAAVVLERSILGNEPLFHVPAYALVQPAELLAYAFLGLVGGIISVLFCKGLLRARTWFASLPRRSLAFQPAMGGLLIGVTLLVVPGVRGVGYEHVDAALNGRMVLSALIVMGGVKLLATIVSYSSGNAGGIFGPTLFIGAMVGGAMGTYLHNMLPTATGPAGAYALVGMGVLFAGIVRAPMTSVFMIFELTQDYQIVLPLMIANMIAYFISRQYLPVSIYDALLKQDGIHIPAAHGARPVGQLRVSDVMNREIPILPADTTVAVAFERIQGRSEPCLPVARGDRFLGFVAFIDLEKAFQEKAGHPVLDLLLDGDGIHVHSDHPLQVALERLGQTHGLLAVVSRMDAERLEGVISIQEIMAAVKSVRTSETS